MWRARKGFCLVGSVVEFDLSAFGCLDVVPNFFAVSAVTAIAEVGDSFTLARKGSDFSPFFSAKAVACATTIEPGNRSKDEDEEPDEE